MIPHAEKIIERAQSGEKVSRPDRLHAVAFYMATMPTTTNREIGEIFGITERAVRQDKKKVREDKASSIKDDDVGLVLADVCMTYDNQIRDIERSKQKCKMGTKEYLAHCKCIFDMQRQKVEALQNLGYYPKNLGNLTVEKFTYKGIVSSDGSVNTKQTDKFDAVEITHKIIEKDMAAIEAEFTDVEPNPLQLESPK